MNITKTIIGTYYNFINSANCFLKIITKTHLIVMYQEAQNIIIIINLKVIVSAI